MVRRRFILAPISLKRRRVDRESPLSHEIGDMHSQSPKLSKWPTPSLLSASSPSSILASRALTCPTPRSRTIPSLSQPPITPRAYRAARLPDCQRYVNPCRGGRHCWRLPQRHVIPDSTLLRRRLPRMHRYESGREYVRLGVLRVGRWGGNGMSHHVHCGPPESRAGKGLPACPISGNTPLSQVEWQLAATTFSADCQRLERLHAAETDIKDG